MIYSYSIKPVLAFKLLPINIRKLLPLIQAHRRFGDKSTSLLGQGEHLSGIQNVVFIGNDSFSIPSLIALKNIYGQVTVVVSSETNLVGKFAKQNFLKTVLWSEFQREDYLPKEYDIGVVASFGYLIPERVINRFSNGILNVHASLLPKYRGAAPINHVIINGDSVTGVSIMKIAAHRFDVGPVYHTKEVPISQHVQALELKIILSHLGAEALTEVLMNLKHYLTKSVQQNEKNASTAPKLSSEMANIRWDIQNSFQIYNLFRGLSGFSKLRTTFNSLAVDLDEIGVVETEKTCSDDEVNSLLHDTKPHRSHNQINCQKVNTSPVLPEGLLSENAEPGQIVFKNDVICVKCGSSNQNESGGWIFVRKVKVGNKWMLAKDFNNGFISKCKKGEVRFEFFPVESGHARRNTVKTSRKMN